MTILLTGGTGFIGSHTVISLLQSGFDVVILDNLSNSSVKILPRLQQITGKPVQFYQGDIRDREILQRIFAEHDIDSVIHFAGLKAVGQILIMIMRFCPRELQAQSRAYMLPSFLILQAIKV